MKMLLLDYDLAERTAKTVKIGKWSNCKIGIKIKDYDGQIKLYTASGTEIQAETDPFHGYTVFPLEGDTVSGRSVLKIKAGDATLDLIKITDESTQIEVGTSGGGSEYELPIASNETLGGVKVSGNDGILNNPDSGHIGVKAGSGIKVDEDGVSIDLPQELHLKNLHAQGISSVNISAKSLTANSIDIGSQESELTSSYLTMYTAEPHMYAPDSGTIYSDSNIRSAQFEIGYTYPNADTSILAYNEGAAYFKCGNDGNWNENNIKLLNGDGITINGLEDGHGMSPKILCGGNISIAGTAEVQINTNYDGYIYVDSGEINVNRYSRGDIVMPLTTIDPQEKVLHIKLEAEDGKQYRIVAKDASQMSLTGKVLTLEEI